MKSETMFEAAVSIVASQQPIRWLLLKLLFFLFDLLDVLNIELVASPFQNADFT